VTVADFRGSVLIGDAWRGHDFTGERVAVIAPGRDAAHIVPALVRVACAVTVFQEDADWVLPVRLPVLRRPLARAHLRLRVRDPWTRRLLTPDRRFGRREPVSSGAGYYRAVQQPNCRLMTWPVYAIVADGVRSAEGIEHRVDCIVIGASSPFAEASAEAGASRR
jgi:cation diffusion facilitator CzcD-associated flavoprotein CzcO